MENCIAIIGAMDEEVVALSASLATGQQLPSPFSDLPLFSGTLENQHIVIARCGIGKVNAALATQYIIDKFNPTVIINTGVAGGLSSKLAIGDLVVGTSSMQHDFDVRNFNYPKGVIPRLATSVFKPEDDLLDLAVQAAIEELGSIRVHQGLIVSGDQFISSQEQKQEILRFFPEAFCAEMEGAAIAQVACVNGTDHLIVRAISDLADNTAPDDFDQYLLRIIPDLNQVIRKIVVSLKNSRFARPDATR
ncbi:MAG: 5'-methylthioadenosine/adenosylhomocysteine nucleosidase [Firmicutes bacterium]|nr:5'-methylthioadenosine/adenosylhomocysteine nucleosidase [Bacillota bacterium]